MKAIDQERFINENLILKSAPRYLKKPVKLIGLKRLRNLRFCERTFTFPTAWTEIIFPNQSENTILKVFEIEKEIIEHQDTIGNLISDSKKFVKIAAIDGYIHLKNVNSQARKEWKLENC